VLTVAAIGAVALARAVRRPASRPAQPELDAAAPASDPTERETTP
jgi:hypothetical protein